MGGVCFKHHHTEAAGGLTVFGHRGGVWVWLAAVMIVRWRVSLFDVIQCSRTRVSLCCRVEKTSAVSGLAATEKFRAPRVRRFMRSKRRRTRVCMWREFECCLWCAVRLWIPNTEQGYCHTKSSRSENKND